MKLLICLFLLLPGRFVSDFKTEQLKKERVKIAYAEKLPQMQELLRQRHLDINQIELYFRAFKHERVLEIWAKNKTDLSFKFLQEVKFCSSSGGLGPKVQAGDGQTPEGFYYINRFHPESNFFLSLGLNYPNAADSIRNKTGNLGGDIFIHGKCATIGCIPITDARIKEVYILAVEASGKGQARIPVHIFPARLTPDNMTQLELLYGDRKDLMRFWQNLKAGYDYFETRHNIPIVKVNAAGKYVLQ